MESKTKRLLIWGLVLWIGGGIFSSFFLFVPLLSAVFPLIILTGLIITIIAVIRIIKERNTPKKIVRIAKRAR